MSLYLYNFKPQRYIKNYNMIYFTYHFNEFQYINLIIISRMRIFTH